MCNLLWIVDSLTAETCFVDSMQVEWYKQYLFDSILALLGVFAVATPSPFWPILVNIILGSGNSESKIYSTNSWLQLRPMPAWFSLYISFLLSCWSTRDNIGRSTRNSNPVMTSSQVVPRVAQTTGSVHPQPNCQLCINTEPTTSVGRLIKTSRL